MQKSHYSTISLWPGVSAVCYVYVHLYVGFLCVSVVVYVKKQTVQKLYTQMRNSVV